MAGGPEPLCLHLAGGSKAETHVDNWTETGWIGKTWK